MNFINESFVFKYLLQSYYIIIILIILLEIFIYYSKYNRFKNYQMHIPKLRLPQISTILVVSFLLISVGLLPGVWGYKYFFISGDILRYSGAVQEILLGKFPPTGPYRVPNAVEWLYKLILSLMIKIGNIDFLETMNIFTALIPILIALSIIEIVSIIYPRTYKIITTYIAVFSGGLGWIKYMIDNRNIYEIPINGRIPPIERINIGLGDLIYRNSGNLSFYYGRGAVNFLISLDVSIENII